MDELTIAADANVRKHLEQIYLHLQLVHSGILVSAAALHTRNREHDVDIASVLTHCVSERLAVQIERIAEVIGQLEATDSNAADPTPEDTPTAHCH